MAQRICKTCCNSPSKRYRISWEDSSWTIQIQQEQESKPKKVQYQKLDERIKRLVDDYFNVEHGEYLNGLAANMSLSFFCFLILFFFLFIFFSFIFVVWNSFFSHQNSSFNLSQLINLLSHFENCLLSLIDYFILSSISLKYINHLCDELSSHSFQFFVFSVYSLVRPIWIQWDLTNEKGSHFSVSVLFCFN